MPPQRESETPNDLSQIAKAVREAFPYDQIAKELIAHAPILALIIQNNVPEAADMPFEELVQRLKHPSSILAMDYPLEGCVGDGPAHLENTEMDGLRADVVVTLMIRDDLIVRVNVEAQNKPHPGYSLDTRSVLYDAELLVDQVRKGWIKGSNYDGLRKVYSIWLISNAPLSLQGEIVCHSIMTTRIRRDGTKQQLPQPSPGADKLCAILAYLPNPKHGIVCADWLSTMGVLLGNSSMAERTQALKKHGIVLEPNFEAKVKKMCTLSQGLIEAGRNEVLPQLEAAIARAAKVEAEKAAIAAEKAAIAAEKDEIAAENAAMATEKANSDNQLRITISALRAQGVSLEKISQLLKTPIEALQRFLLQDSSTVKPTLH